MENVKSILSKMNVNNIYSNSSSDIKALQRALKVKDDGMLGSKTIKALQRALKVTDDGIWGNNSKSAASNFIKGSTTTFTTKHRSMNPDYDQFDNWNGRPSLSREAAETQTPEKYNSKRYTSPVESDTRGSSVTKNSNNPESKKIVERPELSTMDIMSDLANAQYFDGNVPDTYMPGTRKGNATADQIANEYRTVYQNYLTQDVGQGYNYNLATYVPPQKKSPGEVAKTAEDIKTTFDTTYKNLTGNVGTGPAFNVMDAFQGPYAPIWIGNPNAQKDFSFNPENPLGTLTDFNYTNKLGKNIYYTPASVSVKNYTGNGENVQELLEGRTTDQNLWGKELNIGLTQMAELQSQLAESKAAIENAITPEQRAEAERKHRILSDRIALTANAETYKYNGNKVNPFPQGFRQLISVATSPVYSTFNQQDKDRINQGLQQYYTDYGVSPYYSHMPWGERYTLDHLHGASYSYNNSSDQQTPSDIFYKLHDAINGKFNPRTISASFTLHGDRQGVHRHLTQRGEPLTTWTYNNAPVDDSGKVMNKPYFRIGENAYDWANGEYKVGLETTNNYPYGTHQRNNPLFLDKTLTANNPYFNRDLSNFDSWSDTEKQQAAKWLERNGFHTTEFKADIPSLIMNEGGSGSSEFFNSNYDTVRKMLTGIQNAAKSLHNPSEGMQSGQNSMYHFAMNQGSDKVSPIFGNSITGLQMVDGTPSVFNQDVYDISTGPIKMFGNETWYRNTRPLTNTQWNTMLNNTK